MAEVTSTVGKASAVKVRLRTLMHQHTFGSYSDACAFAAEDVVNRHRVNNVVTIRCADEVELDYWEGCEEFGPFPGDNWDMR